MPMGTEQNTESSSNPRDSSECKPFLESANRNLFRKNSFRVTGLPVDATTREVARHADGLLMRAELQQDPHTNGAAFPMTPPPSLDEIREAIQRLKIPGQRIVDEFFWFWPEEFGDSRSDLPMQALAKGDSKTAIEIWSARERSEPFSVAAKHNLALVYHIHALDWENYSVKHENDIGPDRREKITEYWKKSLNRWERLFANDQFWEIFATRIRQLDEPSLTAGVARRMRAALPQALNKINAELAVAFAESGKIEIARVHIQLMRDTSPRREIIEQTAELVLTPYRNRLKDQNQRAKAAADKNPATAHEAARTIIKHTLPMVGLFDLFFGDDEHVQKQVFDEAATTAVNCLVTYQRETGDNATFVTLLERTMPLTASREVQARILKNIGIGQLVLRLQPISTICSAAEKAILDNPASGAKEAERILSVSPSLLAALSNSGSTEETIGQAKDEIALAVMHCAIAFGNKTKLWKLCVGPLEECLRLSVSPAVKGPVTENLATVRSNVLHSGLKPVSIAPSLRTVNGIGVKLYGETDRDAATDSYLTTYYFVFIFVPIFPLARYRISRRGDGYTFFGQAPLRSFDKWHLAVSIGLIVWLFGAMAFSGNSSKRSTYVPPSQSRSTPAYTPPPTVPRPNPNGGTYRVPSAVSGMLDIEKAAIESDRAKVEAMGAQIDQLGREIERERPYVDNTSQFSLGQFNGKVRRYNELNDEAKIAIAAFNKKVDNYNAKLSQYGR